MSSRASKVLVIGGGVAGACAAGRMAEHGIETWLIERKAVIGGYAAELGCKAADVCLRCNVCVAHDLFRKVLAAGRAHVWTQTSLRGLDGDEGPMSPYQARVERKPQSINYDLCAGCGACLKACPSKCISQPSFYGGKAVLDWEKCLRAKGKTCNRCARACAFGAINLAAKPSRVRLEADAIVVATGYQPFDPGILGAYGYRSLPNVITGLEAERQLAQSRKITRPSDGKRPGRIAFIQCVGSRSEHAHRRPEDTDYCSTVCCAYAMRMARKIKYLFPDAAISLFYMDLQNFGKNFSCFLRQSSKEIRLIRARPAEVREGQEGNALIGYEDQDKGAVAQEEFDLVILSVGMRPADDARILADRLRIPVDENGFFGLKGTDGLPDTQRNKIFVIGACESPKDIASCIGQAEAASVGIIAMEKSWELNV